jgi:hypothetical protein
MWSCHYGLPPQHVHLRLRNISHMFNSCCISAGRCRTTELRRNVSLEHQDSQRPVVTPSATHILSQNVQQERKRAMQTSCIPFSMLHARSPRQFDCGEKPTRALKKDPTRRLRMQPPLKTGKSSSSFLWSTPRRPTEHSSSPQHAPACARGQPWSSGASGPSRRGGPSRGPSRPWHGECAQQGHACA